MRKRKIKKAKGRSDTSSRRRKATIKKNRIIKKRIVAPKTRNGGIWSEGEFFQRIRTALRRQFRFWRPMAEALKRASRPYKGPNKLQKYEYQCAFCRKWFKRTEVQIDHIEECGSLNCYEDIVPFIKRLTIENVDGFQVLCKEDHRVKTKKYLKQKKDGKTATNDTF